MYEVATEVGVFFSYSLLIAVSLYALVLATLERCKPPANGTWLSVVSSIWIILFFAHKFLSRNIDADSFGVYTEGRDVYSSFPFNMFSHEKLSHAEEIVAVFMYGIICYAYCVAITKAIKEENRMFLVLNFLSFVFQGVFELQHQLPQYRDRNSSKVALALSVWTGVYFCSGLLYFFEKSTRVL